MPGFLALMFAVQVVGLGPAAAPKDNAEVIQRAIDEAERAGGGVVQIPAGTWTCGTIWLKSNVELHLEDGAVLKASPNLDDYNALDAFEQNYSITNEQWTGRHFIIAHEIENAAITGRGTIDGNSGAFYEEKAPPRRPGIPVWRDGIRMARDKVRLRAGPMIFCIECKNLRFEDFLAKDSPCWCLTLQGCDKVLVRGYRVRCGPTDGNSDGLDIGTCTDVTVRDCDIVTGDDAVAITSSLSHLKHHTKAVCERIRISNCRFSTSAMGIRFGVGEGLVRDVEISDVTVDHAGWAVSFETYYGSFEGRGVDMEDITFRRLVTKDCYGNWRVRAGGDRIVNGVRRVTFDGCTFGGLVYGDLIGDATMPIRDMRFDNCVYSVFPGNTFRNMLKDAPNAGNGTTRRLRFGLMTDTHVTAKPASCHKLRKALELFKAKGCELVVNAGDICDSFSAEGYAGYRRTVEAVFSDMPRERRPAELFAYAWHDAYSYQGHPRSAVAVDSQAAFREVKALLGATNDPTDAKTFGGISFLVFPQFVGFDKFGYEDCAAYERRVAAACAANPGKPVFIVDHIPAYGTVRDSWVWDAGRARVLAKYPQVVHLSGHVHGDIANGLFFWQGGFTEINAGDLFPSGGSWGVVTVDDFDNRIEARRWDLRTGKEIMSDPLWCVRLPYDPAAARRLDPATFGALRWDSGKIDRTLLLAAGKTVDYPLPEGLFDGSAGTAFCVVLDEHSKTVREDTGVFDLELVGPEESDRPVRRANSPNGDSGEMSYFFDFVRPVNGKNRGKPTPTEIAKFNRQYKDLTVTYTDDFHDRFLIIDNTELHGLGSSINCLGRHVSSYTTRDAKEIAKLLAMVP